MSCKVIGMFYVVVARAKYLARRIGYLCSEELRIRTLSGRSPCLKSFLFKTRAYFLSHQQQGQHCVHETMLPGIFCRFLGRS